MTKTTMTRAGTVTPATEKARQDVNACFGKFCLTAGVEALQTMLAGDVIGLCGKPHERRPDRQGYRWGTTKGRIGYQGGNTRAKIARRLTGEPSIILREEIYVSASLIGALIYVGLIGLGVSREASAVTGFAVVLAVRGMD